MLVLVFHWTQNAHMGAHDHAFSLGEDDVAKLRKAFTLAKARGQDAVALEPSPVTEIQARPHGVYGQGDSSAVLVAACSHMPYVSDDLSHAQMVELGLE